jgi:hypothetical protein
MKYEHPEQTRNVTFSESLFVVISGVKIPNHSSEINLDGQFSTDNMSLGN